MHSVLSSLNFAHKNRLNSFKVTYTSKSHLWFIRLYRLGVVLFVRRSLSSLTVLPVFFNLSALVSSLKTFNKGSNKVILSLKALNRLTFLSPSSLFLLSSDFGINSNLTLLKKYSGGRLVAILV